MLTFELLATKCLQKPMYPISKATRARRNFLWAASSAAPHVLYAEHIYAHTYLLQYGCPKKICARNPFSVQTTQCVGEHAVCIIHRRCLRSFRAKKDSCARCEWKVVRLVMWSSKGARTGILKGERFFAVLHMCGLNARGSLEPKYNLR